MNKLLLDGLWIEELAKYRKIYVGYSGGLDSTVLLHALSESPRLLAKLDVVHVNHGLHADADNWQLHCQKTCESLAIPFVSFSVDISKNNNIEERARSARYAVFTELLTEQDCLVLAHHQDDQAETLLLRLIRGSGVDGLAAMVPIKPLANGMIVRPLLDKTRCELEAYAKENRLTWIEDNSNNDERFSRNFIRHQILPLLEKKWPKSGQNIARSARHCQQAKRNLEALAIIDYPDLLMQSNTLSIDGLQDLSQDRLVNVLRIWLKANKVQSPSAKMFKRIIQEVILVRKDADPLVKWGDVSIRRYQQTLYLEKITSLESATNTQWSNFPEPLSIRGENSVLCAIEDVKGIRLSPGSQIEVRYRQGGESLVLNRQTKSLKKLFQQWKIPVWQRSLIPLLYVDNQLAAVVGYAVTDCFYMESADNLFQIMVRCHTL